MKNNIPGDIFFNAPIHPLTGKSSNIALPGIVIFWKTQLLALVPQLMLFAITCHEAYQCFGHNSPYWAAFYVLLAVAFLPLFLLTLGFGLLVEQAVLYARSGIAQAYVIDVLCLQDAGFEEFYKQGMKMSQKEANEVITKFIKQ